MPRTYELPTFLSDAIPVELVARLSGYEVDGNSVKLHCETNRYEPAMHGYYGTETETVWCSPEPGEPATVQLDMCTPEIVRVRYHSGPEVPANDTPMVVGEFNDAVTLNVMEYDDRIIVATNSLRIVVVRYPWQLKIYDRDGRLLWKTSPIDIDAFMRTERQWNPSQQRWIFLHRYAYPLGAAQHGNERYAFASWGVDHDEHIYGFGEGFGPLDKRGTEQNLWLVEGFGNASPGSYKHAPFYMSTRGYGLYVNTSNAVRFKVGNLEHTMMSVVVDDTALLDCYFIYGPTFKEILPRYTAITGRPAVPPKWSFGLWMGRISYNEQEQVETVARDLREHRIPCDVIHIDTDWFENEWECDWKFSPEKFPDPAGMIETLREAGFHVCLWQWPLTLVGTDIYSEAREGGYLATQKNGYPYVFTGFEQDASFIDYSNPDAVTWIQEKFRDLFQQGVAVIKADFGEGAPPAAVYKTVDSESMHNCYPLLYNKAVFEITEEFWGEGNGIIWGRSAWAGSQRYPVHWSGDGIARYEDMPCVLRSTLSFGMSGFPFYSHDVGGFAGLPHSELYVRWAQLGLFSSHTRCHGQPPREPWAYGEEAERIFRRYDELRYRLMPYIYTEAVTCGETSLPMVRALVVEYQDDPTTYTIDDEYLFGDSLLVAPILDTTNHRRVYLPPGEWVDFWTKERMLGARWIEVDAPLDTLPMYVRAGSILPYGPIMQHTDEHPYDPLTLELYLPAGSGAYTIRDQGTPDIPVTYVQRDKTLTVTVGAAPGEVEIVVYGLNVSAAARAGASLNLERAEDGGVWIDIDGREPTEVVFQLQ